MTQHVSAFACSHPPPPSVRSDLGASLRDPTCGTGHSPSQRARKSLPRSQVKCKSKKKEENISPSGNLPINTPDTKVSMELFPSEPAKMSLTDGKSKNKRVLHKQLKDVENEKQQRM